VRALAVSEKRFPAWGFAALGIPAPQGSKRVFGRPGGRPVLVEASPRVAAWRDAVTSAALGAGPRLTGPVAAAVVFSVPRPRGARRADTVPSRRPDLDKLTRALLDAITGANLWADDAQVASLALTKAYAGWSPPAGLDPPEAVLPVPGVVVAAVELHGQDPHAILADWLRSTAAAVRAQLDRWQLAPGRADAR